MLGIVEQYSLKLKAKAVLQFQYQGITSQMTLKSIKLLLQTTVAWILIEINKATRLDQCEYG